MREQQMKRLSDAELEIMQVLWSAGAPVPSTYIREQLGEKRKWALSTLMSVMERLAEKNFVYCDRSTRTNLYAALIQEGEYKASEGKSLLEKLYGSSLKNLVTSLYEENALSRHDISELQRYLNQLQEESRP